jgi:hypothetical protein
MSESCDTARVPDQFRRATWGSTNKWLVYATFAIYSPTPHAHCLWPWGSYGRKRTFFQGGRAVRIQTRWLFPTSAYVRPSKPHHTTSVGGLRSASNGHAATSHVAGGPMRSQPARRGARQTVLLVNQSIINSSITDSRCAKKTRSTPIWAKLDRRSNGFVLGGVVAIASSASKLGRVSAQASPSWARHPVLTAGGGPEFQKRKPI